MKLQSLLSGGFLLLCASCTTTQKNVKPEIVQDQASGLAQKYASYPGYLPPAAAITYINNFKNHRYRGWRKNHLRVVRSTFDRNLISDLTNDPIVDSIYFYMAAFTRKNFSKDSSLIPFVILQAIPVESKESKGGKTAPPGTSAVYFFPRGICPPPEIGCRVSHETN